MLKMLTLRVFSVECDDFTLTDWLLYSLSVGGEGGEYCLCDTEH